MTDSPAHRVACRPEATAIDRSRAVASRSMDGPVPGSTGDTLASALLANGVDGVGDSIYDGRPRGTIAAGHGGAQRARPGDRPAGASEPMVRATQVELVDGLAPTSLAGKGRLAGSAGAADRAGSIGATRTPMCCVVGAGAAGAGCGRGGPGRTRGSCVLDDGAGHRGSWTRLASAPGDAAAAPATTALGLYDHG